MNIYSHINIWRRYFLTVSWFFQVSMNLSSSPLSLGGCGSISLDFTKCYVFWDHAVTHELSDFRKSFWPCSVFHQLSNGINPAWPVSLVKLLGESNEITDMKVLWRRGMKDVATILLLKWVRGPEYEESLSPYSFHPWWQTHKLHKALRKNTKTGAGLRTPSMSGERLDEGTQVVHTQPALISVVSPGPLTNGFQDQKGPEPG